MYGSDKKWFGAWIAASSALVVASAGTALSEYLATLRRAFSGLSAAAPAKRRAVAVVFIVCKCASYETQVAIWGGVAS